jgi:hypothetical protein
VAFGLGARSRSFIFSGEGFGAAAFAGCATTFTGTIFLGVQTLPIRKGDLKGDGAPSLLILDSGHICMCLRFRGGCFLYYIRIAMRRAYFLGSFLFREFALSRDDSGNWYRVEG